MTDSMTSLRCHHGADFFVDGSLCTGTVRGEFLGMRGDGREVSFRILHVCDFRDGRMSVAVGEVIFGSGVAEMLGDLLASGRCRTPDYTVKLSRMSARN